MRALLTIVLLAGCFDPHPLEGTLCSSQRECPGDLHCNPAGVCVRSLDDAGGPDIDAPIIDAEIDAPPGSDLDMDGIPASIDNCPTISNPNQHNEDMDARGDACDLCPHIYQTTFVNGDNDGVDDVCDPHVGMPGDTIAKFYPFDAMSNDFTTTGTWTLANDQYSTATNNASLLIAGSHNHVTAEMGGHITALNGVSREVKIVTGRTTQNTWTSCCFDDTDGSNTFVFEIEDEFPTGTNVLAQPARSKMAVGTFMIRATSVPGGAPGQSCVSKEGNAAQITSMATAPALTAGQVEVFLRSTSVALDYLIIIDSP